MGKEDRNHLEKTVSICHSKEKGTPSEVIQDSELRRQKLNVAIPEPTRHRFHFLKFVTEGSGAHWVDFTRRSLSRGDFLEVRPGQVHALDAESDHAALLLVFRPETVAPKQIH